MKKHEDVPIRIEWIDTVRDMPALLALENESEAPWTQADFLQELASRNVCGFAAWRGSTLLGFYVYLLTKHDILILNMKAHAEGYAITLKALLAKLKAKLRKGLRSSITIVVPETDLRLQLALKSEKFLATKIVEDGYVFEFTEGPKLQVVMDKDFMAGEF